MTAVGFEPTPFRTSALSWRLRPLGHAIVEYNVILLKLIKQQTVAINSQKTKEIQHPRIELGTYCVLGSRHNH